MTNHLAEYLESSASRFGSRTAVVDPGGWSLSYADLDRQADALAGWLAASGVRPGDRVGVVLPKSVPSVVALFGIMKAGAAYVPVDCTAPAERGRGILADCAIRALVADGSSLATAPPAGAGGPLPVILVGEPPDGPLDGVQLARYDEVVRGQGPAPRLPARCRGSRLHPLHVRVDRHAEGRDADAPERHELRRLVFVGLHAGRARPFQQPRAVPLRPVGARHLPVPQARRHAVPGLRGAREESEGARAIRRRAPADGLVLDAVDPRAAAPVRRARDARPYQSASRALRGRGVPGQAPARPHAGVAPAGLLQPVRTDRDERLHVREDSHGDPGRPRHAVPDRVPVRALRDRRARRRRAGDGRRRGGAPLRQRTLGIRRLLEPPGRERGRLRRARRFALVQHGRRRALGSGRGLHLRGPARSHGQAARLPHRARRDRAGALPARRGARGRRRGDSRRGVRRPDRRVPRVRRRRAAVDHRDEDVLRVAPARVHEPRSLSVRAAPASHVDRQGRLPVAAAAVG